MEFERTYFKNVKENDYVFVLYEILGIEKYKRIEVNLKGDILERSTDVSYQKAAELCTPASLTRESVKKVIRENGAIDNLELEVNTKIIFRIDVNHSSTMRTRAWILIIALTLIFSVIPLYKFNFGTRKF